jgi:hypothetical protein
MADEPRWPEWMDQKTLAAYIGKKPSTIRTLMKHGALPRPSRWGSIVLWNRKAVDMRLMMGGPEPPPHLSHTMAAATLIERVRREREEDCKPYVSIFDQPNGSNVGAALRRKRRRRI